MRRPNNAMVGAYETLIEMGIYKMEMFHMLHSKALLAIYPDAKVITLQK